MGVDKARGRTAVALCTPLYMAVHGAEKVLTGQVTITVSGQLHLLLSATAVLYASVKIWAVGLLYIASVGSHVSFSQEESSCQLLFSWMVL